MLKERKKGVVFSTPLSYIHGVEVK